MTPARLAPLCALLVLAGCASGGRHDVPLVYQLNADVSGSTAAGGTPETRDPTYAAQLTEEQRRAWFLARRPEPPAVRYVPRADNGPHPPPEPVRVIHEYRDRYDAAWAVPITLGIGYGLYRLKRHGDRRHHHHHHGVWVDWWAGYRW